MQMEDGNVPNQVPVPQQAYIPVADVASIVRAVMEGMGNAPQQPLQRGETSDQGRAGLLSSFKKVNPPMFNADSNPQVA